MGVPSNIIIPFVGVEFDSSRAFAGPANLPVKTLLIGQKTATGTGTSKEQILVSNADEVGVLAGSGSVAHRMAIKYFNNNRVTDTYVILLDDAATSTAYVLALTLTGTATKSGELVVYINGDRYAVGVAVGATAESIATALVDVIDDDPAVPVTVGAVGGVITFTAKNKGIAAGDIDIRLNYNDGEAVPAGIVATFGTPTEGTVDPDIDDALDEIGDTWFNILTSPYNDATNLGLVEDYLEAQAGPMVQRDGVYYCAKRGTRSELITFATNSSRNSPYAVLIANTNVPHSNYEVSAAYAARVAESIMDDTAVPLHRMTLTSISPVPTTDRWTPIERNQLATNGIATLTHTLGVQTEATVTMYLKNSAGASDIAYQQQNTVFQLMYLRYTFVNRILTRYPRAKLADNIDRIESGQQVMTPDVGKTEAVAWFSQLEAAGIVENITQFKNDIVVRRSESNPNRLEWLLPPDLVNQFIVGSADLQFLLQSPSN